MTSSGVSLRFSGIEGAPVQTPPSARVIGITLPPDGPGPRPSSRSVAPGRPTAQRFTDETVVVTGARRVIGAAIAKRFAREGAAVLVSSEEDAVDTEADDIRHAGGQAHAMLDDVTEDECDLIMAVNTNGIFLCGQAAIEAMRELGRGGRRMNMASGQARNGFIYTPSEARRLAPGTLASLHPPAP